MTDINAAAIAARENARHPTGQFGEQQHTPPELRFTDPRTPLPVIVTARLATPAVIEYPVALPAGGKVEADLEDSGGVYVSIKFADQLDEDGNPIRISMGRLTSDDYATGDEWNSIENGEPGFSDDTLNAEALRYLRALHTSIDADAEAVRWAATQPYLQMFVERATTPAQATDYSEEASLQRSQGRGEQLVGAFADGGNDLDDNAADAIADILEYVKSQGLDIDDVIRRARSYTEDD